MPPGCDLGVLLDELARLQLFAIEHSDDGAVLVPAELASPKMFDIQTDANPSSAARRS